MLADAVTLTCRKLLSFCLSLSNTVPLPSSLTSSVGSSKSLSLSQVLADWLLGSATSVLSVSLAARHGDWEATLVAEALTVQAGVWLIECLCGAVRRRGGVIWWSDEGSRLLGEEWVCSLRDDLRVSVWLKLRCLS